MCTCKVGRKISKKQPLKNHTKKMYKPTMAKEETFVSKIINKIKYNNGVQLQQKESDNG